MNYRKKPVQIQALQWDGTYSGVKKINDLFPDLETIAISFHEERNIVSSWRIKTLEGGYNVWEGDFIIKGIKGEFYPCEQDIFKLTYDEC